MPAPLIARWTDWHGQGVEHLVLRQSSGLRLVQSVVIGPGTAAWQYALVCDLGWRTCSARLHRIGQDLAVELRADGLGRWTDGVGRPLPELQGVLDLEIGVTPFTTTLALHRLGLRSGETASLAMVQLDADRLVFRRVERRLACLDRGRRYRLDTPEETEFEVEDNLLVTAWPGRFRRLVPQPA
ncbi:putative glycolipid-binding domain-containing protein [Teichococcus aerofrigidensis]